MPKAPKPHKPSKAPGKSKPARPATYPESRKGC